MAKRGIVLGLLLTSFVHGHPAQVRQFVRDISLSSIAVTTSYASTVTSLQTASITAEPQTTGTVNTEITSTGSQPFPTAPPVASTTLAPAATKLMVQDLSATAAVAANIFQAIATDAPPSQFSVRDDHPVPKTGIKDGDVPLETNKFYANLFLGTQLNGAWTHPYSVSSSAGTGNAGSWGLAVSHIERSQLAYASGDPPVQYFIGPIGIQSMILSAAELGSSTNVTSDTLKAFSANINFAPSDGADSVISFPLVQGMAFVTGVYSSATPRVESSVFFRNITSAGLLSNGKTYKWQVALEDSTSWLLYVTPTGSVGAPPFTLINSTRIEGPTGFSGVIQVTKNNGGSEGEAIFDSSAGTYPTGASISATVDGDSGSYTLTYEKGGNTDQTLLMYALPHHVESFDSTTAAAATDLQLMTVTKGAATLVQADALTMVESNLPSEIGFAPWSPSVASRRLAKRAMSQTAITAINDAATVELAEDMVSQTDLNSMYYSGKALAKFASIIYAVNDLAGNSELAAAGLEKLESAFATFVNNQQILPLVYDNVWKGVVSSGTYDSGDTGLDFGNTLYNDHHFHYGYFVYTAAVIGYLDSTWLANSTNTAWVNALIRDYANSVEDDPYFPFSRSYDWFHGHSWAKGLFESGDSKDQESTSEDAFSSYALKMWGKVIGDANLEARGNLMLAVSARSYHNYFLLESNNTVQPPEFIDNKVTGILFENKVDHTTYFGSNVEYIEGIHMLPLNPSSAYTRTQNFVTEEWNRYFAATGTTPAANVTGGWKGILYANLAIIDPVTSFDFFNAADFDYSTLDGGASRTWYLAYAAGLGGA